MSMTDRALVNGTNGVPFAEAAGGIVTVILAILGLAHVIPNYLVPITTIVFGAVLLNHGAGLLSEYGHLARPGAATPAVRMGGGLSAIFLVGAGGIVLGILALVGVDPMILCACAVLAYGAVLVLSANSTTQLHAMQTTRPEGVPGGGGMMAEEIVSDSGGFLAMAGLAAVVLGILALAGFAQEILILVSLLVVGAAIVVSGGALTSAMMTFFRTT